MTVRTVIPRLPCFIPFPGYLLTSRLLFHETDFAEEYVPTDPIWPLVPVSGTSFQLAATDCPPPRGRAQTGDFKVALDPGSASSVKDILVKLDGRTLRIGGKREEGGVDEGFTASRQFSRSYYIGEGVDLRKMTSSLTEEGYLIVKAPKLQPATITPPEKVIPIQREAPDDLTAAGDKKERESTEAGDENEGGDMRSWER